MDAWLLLSVSLFGLVALIGFFVTKTKGFGRFSTSALLLITVTVVSAMLFTSDKLDSHTLENIFFAVIGFAAGLFTGRDTDPPKG